MSAQIVDAVESMGAQEKQWAFNHLQNTLGNSDLVVAELAVHLLARPEALTGALSADAKRAVIEAAGSVPGAAAHLLALARDDEPSVRAPAREKVVEQLVAGDRMVKTELDVLRVSGDEHDRALYLEILAAARGVVPSRAARDGGPEPGAAGDVVVEPPTAEATAEMFPTVVETANETDDYEGILSRTSAAIARGDPRMVALQVRDVGARMRRLADDPAEHDTVRQAAHTAEAALATVQGLLDGDVEFHAATPVLRGLNSLALDIIDLGLPMLSPEAAVIFKATRMTIEYIGGRWKITGLGGREGQR